MSSSAFGFRHEALSRRIVLDPRFGVHQVLRTVASQLPAQIADMIMGQGPARYAQIVSSQLDDDRFDYLLRDVTMTGVTACRFDFELLLVLLRADEYCRFVDDP